MRLRFTIQSHRTYEKAEQKALLARGGILSLGRKITKVTPMDALDLLCRSLPGEAVTVVSADDETLVLSFRLDLLTGDFEPEVVGS